VLGLSPFLDAINTFITLKKKKRLSILFKNTSKGVKAFALRENQEASMHSEVGRFLDKCP
jgi:hypothetical protein